MLTMAERVRDLRHRIAEIVGGVTPPQDYELDGAILAAFEEVARAARQATPRPVCAYARSDMTPCYLKDGDMALSDDRHCVGCGRSF